MSRIQSIQLQASLFPGQSLPDICLSLRGHLRGTHELPIDFCTDTAIQMLNYRIETWQHPSDEIDCLVKQMCEQTISLYKDKQ